MNRISLGGAPDNLIFNKKINKRKDETTNMKDKLMDILKNSDEELLLENLIYELSKDDNFLKIVFQRVERQFNALKDIRNEAYRISDKLLNDRLKHGLSGEFNPKTSKKILELAVKEVSELFNKTK